MTVFVKDPTPHLAEQKIQLPCPVHPDRTAQIRSDFLERINWEFFYFSDAEARKTFRKDPLAYCGLLTDPVDGTRFHPTKESPSTKHGGRLYYFSSPANLRMFRDMPKRYADRMGM